MWDAGQGPSPRPLSRKVAFSVLRAVCDQVQGLPGSWSIFRLGKSQLRDSMPCPAPPHVCMLICLSRVLIL